MRPFEELTQPGRVRRIRTLALEALAQYALKVKALIPLDTSFNTVFRVDTEGGKRFVIRVSSTDCGHAVANTRAEVAWLLALAAHSDIPVPRLLKTTAGEPFVVCEVRGVPQPRTCVVFHWIPGRDLGSRLSLKRARSWGGLMARLHRQGAKLQLPEGCEAPVYDRVFHWPEPEVILSRPAPELMPHGRRRVFQAALAWAEEVIARMTARGDQRQLIHGDLHPRNIRVQGEAMVPIDFEDLLIGWPAQDIGIALFYRRNRDDAAELREAFREGYSQHRPWPDTEGDEVDAYIAARALELGNLIMQSENSDTRAQAGAFFTRQEAQLRRLLSKHGRDLGG